MPRDTFYNLHEEKKNRIIQCSIDEFAEYTYHNASITRIVNNAKIAKGSFYQYFKDKKDLFKYIIEICGNEKIRYLQRQSIKNTSYFEIVRDLYIAGIKFAKDNPKLSLIANNFIKEDNLELKEEILGANIPKSNQFFEIMLKEGIEKGDIDPNIDIELVAYMFTTMSISISDYFIKEIKAEDDMEIMKLIDKMLYVFKNGIQRKGEI